MAIDDSITAFPVEGYCSGMSLRDYFAAKAMQGIMSRVDGCHPADTKEDIGKWSYRVADAMLKAREDVKE